MPLNPDATLPKWAKIVKPMSLPTSSSGGREPLSSIEEETYIRTRCYHILASEMDNVIFRVMKESLEPVLASLEIFLDASCPCPVRSNSSTPPHSTRKRARLATSEPPPALLEGLDGSLFDRQQENSTPHDPLLLPFLVLQGPFFGPDRQDQINVLLQMLQDSRKRAAVVKVERNSNNNNNNNRRRFPWMQALIRQCHQQYPILHSESLHRRITKRKKKKACTFSEMLLLWAQHVTCYDELVIFLNVDDSYYNAEFHDFLHLLATLRAEHGVPLSVLLLGPQDGRRNVELRSSLQGYAGFTVRSIALPTPIQLLETFWIDLWVKQRFPVMFPPLVLAAIRMSFEYHQMSTNRTIAKLKQALAYFLAQRGSFMSVANDRLVLDELWQRIAYYFVERRVQPLLMEDTLNHISNNSMRGLEDIDSTRQRAQVVLELLERVQSASRQNNGRTSALFLDGLSFSTKLRTLEKKDLLEVLRDLRQKAETNDVEYACRQLFVKAVKCESLSKTENLAKDYQSQPKTLRQDLLNELMILVGSGRDVDDFSEIEEILEGILAQWIFSPADCLPWRKCGASGDRNQCLWTTCPPECDWESAVESFVAEPRRKTVAALYSRSVLDRRCEDGLSIANVASTMYHLIHDCVAVTQEDWYQEFWQKAIVGSNSPYSREESVSLFSVGLRNLKQCGLINENIRVGSRNGLIYERAKLVWCG